MKRLALRLLVSSMAMALLEAQPPIEVTVCGAILPTLLFLQILPCWLLCVIDLLVASASWAALAAAFF
jgi:hypothetical protein